MEITEQTPALWQIQYVLTAEEVARGLYLTDPRRKSRVRIAIESAILGVGTVYFLVGYLTGDTKVTRSLVLALFCAFFLGMLWWAPKLQAANLARRTAKQQQTITVRGYEGALGFGSGEAFTACAFSEFTIAADETVLALQFAGGRLLVIPRRAAEGAVWAWLNQQSREAPEQSPDAPEQSPDDSQQGPDDSQQGPDDSQQSPEAPEQSPDDSQQGPDAPETDNNE